MSDLLLQKQNAKPDVVRAQLDSQQTVTETPEVISINKPNTKPARIPTC